MTKMHEGVTRREALAFMGIGGAAAAAFSLVGCAPEPAGNQTEGNASDAQEPEKVEEIPTEYVDTEVIVVGAGGGGLCAALSAAYYGAKSVMVFEKHVAPGGNSLLSHGSITVPAPPDYARAPMTPQLQNYLDDILLNGPINESEERWWDQLMAEYNDYLANGDTTKCFDSALFCSLDYARKDEITVEQEMVFYYRVPEFVDWVLGQTGAKLKMCYGGSGYPWPRTTSLEGSLRGEGWINSLMAGITENNYPVDIKLSTPVVSLITDDDGKVVGVNAVKPDGGKIAAFASRGVVLACGGFTANNDMLQQYNMSWPFKWMKNALTDGVATTTGDGMLMSQAIGGAVAQMERIQCLTQCDAKTGAENTLIGDRSKTLLRVNCQGKRFAPEDASRNEMTRAILKLPEGYCVQISDSLNALVADGKNAFGVPVSTLEDLGTLFIADTIEELGKKFGADPAVFAETVANYNKYCDDLSDPEFGCTLLNPDCKLVEPPFYAYCLAPATHITYGGLVVDDNFKVVKYDLVQSIDGLYSIGDCREGAGGLDIALPDGYYVGKHLMKEVAAEDRAAIKAQVQEEEEKAKEAAKKAAEEAEAAKNVSYKDGTYEGVGGGVGGDITVSLTITNGVITVTNIGPNNETVGVGGYEAIENGTYAAMIEKAQSAHIDTIAGATVTSNAIQTAVANALEGAKK